MERSSFTVAGLHLRHQYSWNSLQIFNFYRLILAILFLSFAYLRDVEHFLGETNPALFIVISFCYFAIAITSIVLTHFKNIPYNYQLSFQVICDTIALTCVMHASGGLVSGLGTLLLVALAGASLLRPGKASLYYAGFGVFAILTEQLFVHFHDQLGANAYTPAGLLSLALFATALTANILAKRLGMSQAALMSLELLNGHIIEQLHTGVLIIDAHNQVRLMNHTATLLLNKRLTGPIMAVEICESLNQQLDALRNNVNAVSSTCFLTNNYSNVSASLHKFNVLNCEILVFLEDITRQVKEAQQMKLVALGRLTASIAHEIRNPLGAISHAAQLLSESALVTTPEKRLIQIIHDNSYRTNTVIQNILSLSRFRKNKKKALYLREWVHDFVTSFISPAIQDPIITWQVIPEHLNVFMDPSHLHQVLTNLCENGLHYNFLEKGVAHVEICATIDIANNSPYLEIIDNGPGVSEEISKRLFEPFVTSEAQGTGLGLFIARELCSANQAKLEYFINPAGGSRFRITFPSQMEVTETSQNSHKITHREMTV